LDSLKIREESIDEALKTAERAREEMAQLKEDNQKLLEEARQEREKILKEATSAAGTIKEEAKAETVKTTEKMIEDAKAVINAETQSALGQVRAQVATLSLAIAEKILRKNLEREPEQKKLVDGFIKDIKLN